ncbi:MAG: DNA cytosine methyltransferase [Flavobacteriales bacterium]|nr:DNA cytosine methyltransferase [Flavobacteriales bacterium]MCB9167880.1 DNA cytosine methyltransferase [Flavobacteriales bacterium]
MAKAIKKNGNKVKSSSATSVRVLPKQGTHGLRVASFFSGIGGIDLGFERAGYSTTFQCEINKYCNTILNRHWPHVPKATNIKDISNADVPLSEVWTGGFPCQDVSLARMGTRAGLQGARSGLFHKFARILGEGRPRVVLLENVHGLLNSHRGRDFEVVIRTLAELGYAVGWRVLNSKNFGVPQSRQRVYIVGCYRDPRGPSQILFEPERGPWDTSSNGSDEAESLSPFKRVIRVARGERPVVQGMAYCLYATSARHTGTDWSRTYVTYPHKGAVRRLTPTECEGIMGFPEGWTIGDALDDKVSDVDSLRYHALGNAVTPPVAEWIAGRIANYLINADKAVLESSMVNEPLAACV